MAVMLSSGKTDAEHGQRVGVRHLRLFEVAHRTGASDLRRRAGAHGRGAPRPSGKSYGAPTQRICRDGAAAWRGAGLKSCDCCFCRPGAWALAPWPSVHRRRRAAVIGRVRRIARSGWHSATAAGAWRVTHKANPNFFWRLEAPKSSTWRSWGLRVC